MSVSILSPQTSPVARFNKKIINYINKLKNPLYFVILATVFLCGCSNFQQINKNLTNLEENTNLIKKNSYLKCEKLEEVKIKNLDELVNFNLNLINKYYVCLNINNNLNYSLFF